MTGNDPLRYPATLPGLLGKAGYQTQAVGKMHHYPQRRRYGFDHMILDEEGRRFGDFISDYDLWFDDHNEEEYGTRDHSIDWNSWMARPSHLPEQMHPTHWTASEGSHFLRHRDPTSPFFMWLSFARPHSPYDPPQAYWDLYINNPDIPEPVFGDWTEPYKRRVANVNSPWNDLPLDIVRRARVGYYGNITFIDHQIGKVLYELSKFDRETLDNTFVIFTSDHGDMMGRPLPLEKNLRVRALGQGSLSDQISKGLGSAEEYHAGSADRTPGCHAHDPRRSRNRHSRFGGWKQSAQSLP
ncbi:MAG: sulfatase-like hydrolase/transferase, partial [Candidatus Omnitrophica bacterium]|nr:sulfatase-like hydrolase/transferase [Candidatus Omnitrophota bacterium]